MKKRKECSRRQFLIRSGLGGAAITALPVMPGITGTDTGRKKTGNQATPDRPNILYLHSHDTGRYIRPYGYRVPTPNLQKLAAEGILFRNYFTTHPTCSPSRGSLLTGTYPHTNGLTGLAHRGFALDDYSWHIIHTLKKTGYTTALAGIQHVASHRQGEPWKTIGYDRHLGHAEEAHTKAVEFLDNAPENPFFLSVGFFETHRKFPDTSSKPDARWTEPPESFPDSPETRQDMADFRESARILDDKMGQVLDALERNGLKENTLVICTTDHGIAFPRMKCNLTDGGIGIFLIMRGPGGFTGGRVIDSLLSVIDVYPTLCDLLKIPVPDYVQGKSFMPVIRGEYQEINNEIFAEVNYHASYEPVRCVRTKRYKFIVRYGERRKPVLTNCDDGLTKSYLLAYGWKDHVLPDEELYDLVFDPNENHNLAGEQAYAEVLSDLKNRLRDWMVRTGDPMNKGYIPAPSTADLNDPDDITPNDKKRVTPPHVIKK